MVNIDVNDSVAMREAGYKALVKHLGFEDTIKFIKHFYDESANKEKNQQPDISWEQFLTEIEKYRW